jgi:hypothetical protein
MTERTVVTPADLSIVQGDATPEEIAALVAVLLPGGETPRDARPAQSPRSAWTDRNTLLRQPNRPAPGAWRRSALP